MEMLFVMVLLFPAPCGYCVGPLCKLGVPLQIQTVGVYGDVGIETIIPGNRLRSVGIPQHIDSLLCIASSSIHFRFCQPFSIRKSRFLIIVSVITHIVDVETRCSFSSHNNTCHSQYLLLCQSSNSRSD